MWMIEIYCSALCHDLYRCFQYFSLVLQVGAAPWDMLEIIAVCVCFLRACVFPYSKRIFHALLLLIRHAVIRELSCSEGSEGFIKSGIRPFLVYKSYCWFSIAVFDSRTICNASNKINRQHVLVDGTDYLQMEIVFCKSFRFFFFEKWMHLSCGRHFSAPHRSIQSKTH